MMSGTSRAPAVLGSFLASCFVTCLAAGEARAEMDISADITLRAPVLSAVPAGKTLESILQPALEVDGKLNFDYQSSVDDKWLFGGYARWRTSAKDSQTGRLTVTELERVYGFLQGGFGRIEFGRNHGAVGQFGVYIGGLDDSSFDVGPPHSENKNKLSYLQTLDNLSYGFSVMQPYAGIVPERDPQNPDIIAKGYYPPQTTEYEIALRVTDLGPVSIGAGLFSGIEEPGEGDITDNAAIHAGVTAVFAPVRLSLSTVQYFSSGRVLDDKNQLMQDNDSEIGAAVAFQMGQFDARLTSRLTLGGLTVYKADVSSDAAADPNPTDYDAGLRVDAAFELSYLISGVLRAGFSVRYHGASVEFADATPGNEASGLDADGNEKSTGAGFSTGAYLKLGF